MKLKNPVGYAGLFSLGFIDHLAPICSLLNIPLVTCDTDTEQMAETFYPGLKVLYQPYFQSIPFTVKNFDTLISCLKLSTIERSFRETELTLNKTLHKVWCPHGNSDKGHIYELMERLTDEEFLLTYGQKMIDFIQFKNPQKPEGNFFQLGNYRYDYYQKNRSFYENLMKTLIPQNNKLNVLYCPTWGDFENSSTFLESISSVIQHLPEDMNLLVKAHPNTKLYERGELEVIALQNKKSDVYFIHDIPTIYPLLDQVDAYIGDLSSVNYDCLAFDLPMYFLHISNRNPEKDRGLYSFQFGTKIKKNEILLIYQKIRYDLKNPSQELKNIRKRAYHYTFGEIDIPNYKSLFSSSSSSDG